MWRSCILMKHVSFESDHSNFIMILFNFAQFMPMVSTKIITYAFDMCTGKRFLITCLLTSRLLLTGKRFLINYLLTYLSFTSYRETLSNRSDQVLEGFSRLYNLISFDLLTPEIWERVMPHWLDSMYREASSSHLQQITIMLKYVHMFWLFFLLSLK